MAKKKKYPPNYCGGFKAPKGHLDTQLYPECEPYPTNRDIVKKTMEKEEKEKKEKKKKKSDVDSRLIEARLGEEFEKSPLSKIWDNWKTKGYNQANPPSLDVAKTLNFWAKRELANTEGEYFIPPTTDHKYAIDRAKEALNLIEEDPIAASLKFAEALYEAERIVDRPNKAAFNLQRYLHAKKKSPKYDKSPTEEGFIDECMKKNKDKGDPGAYCAAIVDRAKGTTDWRKGTRKKKKD